MSYQLSIHNHPDYIELVFHNPSTIEDHVTAKAESVALCMQKGINRILVDTSAVQAHIDFSKKQLLDFAHTETVGLARLEKALYVALILPVNVRSQNEMYFLIDLMRQRGLRIEPFFTRTEALESLLAQTGPSLHR